MEPFQIISPQSLTEISDIFKENHAPVHILAGGTDLTGEMKENLISPNTLVDLTNIQNIKGITKTPMGLKIGALTTISQIESDIEITSNYPALAQAASAVATPQIRNIGTLGGNLCQRPRCWYYRNSAFNCLKKGGEICHALTGNNKFNAILGGNRCYIVHPSDLAVALIALKSDVTIGNGSIHKTIQLEEFFIGPQENIHKENILSEGDILESISLPTKPKNQRSIFIKAKERSAMDFALSSVAIVINLEGKFITDSSVVIGGVAPTPYRVLDLENQLNGKSIFEVNPEKISIPAIENAIPLKHNSFKISLTLSLLSRAMNSIKILPE